MQNIHQEQNVKNFKQRHNLSDFALAGLTSPYFQPRFTV